mmetsp:Transcript_26475/g.50275  ORF Transcript_26475/g.50275 Transcript_26475/m.50275 type:complete len:252 (-) Transcript_26475:437-1192(-)
MRVASVPAAGSGVLQRPMGTHLSLSLCQLVGQGVIFDVRLLELVPQRHRNPSLLLVQLLHSPKLRRALPIGVVQQRKLLVHYVDLGPRLVQERGELVALHNRVARVLVHVLQTLAAHQLLRRPQPTAELALQLVLELGHRRALAFFDVVASSALLQARLLQRLHLRAQLAVVPLHLQRVENGELILQGLLVHLQQLDLVSQLVHEHGALFLGYLNRKLQPLFCLCGGFLQLVHFLRLLVNIHLQGRALRRL